MLTFREDEDVCVWGLLGWAVGPQHSFWAGAGSALPSETPANSGKSFILTSNGTEFSCAGFDLPAEFGADRAPLKPVVQLQPELYETWLKKEILMAQWIKFPDISLKNSNLWMTSTFFLWSQRELSHNFASSGRATTALQCLNRLMVNHRNTFHKSKAYPFDCIT